MCASYSYACACTLAHEGTVRLLLEAAAAVNSTDGEGRTARMFASMEGHAGAMLMLLEAPVFAGTFPRCSL